VFLALILVLVFEPFLFVAAGMAALLVGLLGAAICKHGPNGFRAGLVLGVWLALTYFESIVYGPDVHYAISAARFKLACRRIEQEKSHIAPIATDGIVIYERKFSGIGGGCTGLCALAEDPKTYLRQGAPVAFVEKNYLRYTEPAGEHSTASGPASHGIRVIHMREEYISEFGVEVTERRTGQVVNRVRQLRLGQHACPSDNDMRVLIRRLVRSRGPDDPPVPHHVPTKPPAAFRRPESLDAFVGKR
jgi:hypothetical protein